MGGGFNGGGELKIGGWVIGEGFNESGGCMGGGFPVKMAKSKRTYAYGCVLRINIY